jgi:Zn-dependent M28 family amino/carboxypeptidase
MALVASIAAVPSTGPTTTAAPQQTAAGALIPPALQTALAAVEAEDMRPDLRFLSDDLLEGRGTGQRGGTLAARYLETRMQQIGLLPGASASSYLQEVPLVGIETLDDSRFTIVAGGVTLTPERLVDYVANSETQETISSIEAPVVFAGFGIVAPEYQWDDFKGFDVKGKVLLLLVNDPPSDDPKFFGGPALTYYGRWTYKYESAARAGAAGAILIHTNASAGYGWNVVKNSWGGERPYLARDASSPKALGLVSWVSEPFARRALTAAGEDFEALRQAAGRRDFRPRPLKMTVQAHLVHKVRPLMTWNVIGRLPGSDPKGAAETVVLTAHYDHLGIGPAEDGDAIYNGAADNASGVSALLEAARAFRALPRPPRRTLLFIACAAEEGGLRGSEYYVRHPVVPLDRTIANINMDGLPVWGQPRDYNFMGGDRSTLRSVIGDAAAALDFEVISDPHPDQGSFYRSDQFNFARAGVPAFGVHPGVHYLGKPEGWGEASWKEYEAKQYHRPKDEYDPKFDLSGMAQVARIATYVGWRVAEDPRPPEWNEGDEFAAARAASRQEAAGRP